MKEKEALPEQEAASQEKISPESKKLKIDEASPNTKSPQQEMPVEEKKDEVIAAKQDEVIENSSEQKELQSPKLDQEVPQEKPEEKGSES